jgi:hypothetical protein
MKHLKMLGIAAVAALALMAVVGSATASAKICSSSGTGTSCGASDGNEFTGAFSATATNATLTSGFVTVSCTDSVASGNILNSSTGAGNITGLTFSGCSNNLGGGCEASTTASSGAPWTAGVAHTTGTNGTLTVSNVQGEFTCTIFGGPVKCIYAATTAKAEVVGGTPATVKATKVALAKQAGSNALCSTEGTWSGTYTVTSPASLFIT